MRSLSFRDLSLGLRAPLVAADFTTGTYKADGVTKTFDELFTFNRAGKAWLVKDTGLTEYAVDEPRFDNGLLIEQSATNTLFSSDDYKNGSWTLQGNPTVIVKNENGLRYSSITKSLTDNNTAIFKANQVSASSIMSVYARGLVGRNAGLLYHHQESKSYPLQAEWSRFTGRLGTNVFNSYYYLCDFRVGNADYVDMFGAQIENGVVPSTLIPTTTTPVTRPADFLTNKITGTTITGDWDSTLNLSISNGQIVHSGYGRIRSLEIN